MRKVSCFVIAVMLLAMVTSVFAEGSGEKAAGKKTVTWWALSAGGGEGDDIH